MNDMRPLPDTGLARAARARPEAPGRSCPLHYLYSPRALARAPDLAARTVYVVGGLYGNPMALDAVEILYALAPEHWGRPERVAAASTGVASFTDRRGHL